jgi:protein-S-isoprenylcysteine O-methyltransferase Ste14
VAFQAKGKAPEGKNWIQTSVLVDSGIYAIVRHPMYLSFILIIISLILISQHWLSLIFGIPIVMYFYLSMGREESSSIEKFGDDYKSYMKSVPRMNLILGIIRLWRRQKHR